MTGPLYSYGNIQPYLVSYIRSRSQPSTLRYSESIYLYSTQFAGFAVGLALGCIAIKLKLGTRMLVITGGISMSLGLLLSYITIQYSYWLLFVTFGVMYSTGIGVAIMAPMICAMKWVSPKHSGLAVGVSLLGSGLGGLVFAALQTSFINPNNQFPNEAPYRMNPDELYFTQSDLIDTVPSVFLIQGSISIVITFFSSIFMTVPATPNDSKTVPEASLYSKTSHSLLFREAAEILSQADFYSQWAVSLLNITVFGVISSSYKTYGLEILKASDSFLTVLGAVANGVFNTLGRILIGLLVDKIGYRDALAIQSVTMAVLTLTLPITSLGYPIMYFIWISGIFLCFGAYCAAIAVTITKRFGEEHFSVGYMLIVASSQIVASFLYGMVSDFSVDNFGWLWTFFFIGCLSIIQTLLVLSFSEENSPAQQSGMRKKYKVHYVLNALYMDLY